VSLVAMIAFAFPETASADETDPTPAIRVLIYNYTQASHAVLSGAEREAGRIFAEAGVRILWFECPAVKSADPQELCHKAPEAVDIRLQLLSALVRSKSQDDVWGLAVRPSSAIVYYEDVVRLAVVYEAEFGLGRILGSVIAHEIGHLLLGANSHYGIGIMRPQWSFEQVRQAMMGTLLFTPVQSKNIRAEARRRDEATAAGLRTPAVVVQSRRIENRAANVRRSSLLGIFAAKRIKKKREHAARTRFVQLLRVIPHPFERPTSNLTSLYVFRETKRRLPFLHG